MVRLAIVLLSLLVLTGCPVPDTYPGDGPYTRKVLELLGKVRNDRIDFPWAGNRTLTREELCRELAGRHFRGNVGNPAMSNAQWLNCPGLTEDALIEACTGALANPDGFDGPEGWNAWRGRHQGTWFQDGEAGKPDEARWDAPRKETSKVPGDTQPGSNDPREYDFQQVHWPDREVGHWGWNQSHPDVPYVWGWDPKQNGNENGDIGTHLGIPFSISPCHFIVWITPKEAFQEGINPSLRQQRNVNGQPVNGYPKTSTGFNGRGRWLVER